MGFFGRKNEGGLMDVIRCDEGNNYIIWKWSPAGKASKRENEIRYGSTLRVKEGEVAVFVYRQSDGTMQDYIEGPYDKTIKTDNFPVLASIVGSAFGGSSPFQAEIYFINLAGQMELPLNINNVSVSSNVQNFTIPSVVRGNILFNILDYRNFIKAHKLNTLYVPTFVDKIRATVESCVGSIVGKAPKNFSIPVFELDTYKMELAEKSMPFLKNSIENIFAINILQFNISAIIFNEQSTGYKDVDTILKRRAMELGNVMNEAAKRDVEDKRNIANVNLVEVLAAQVEETQHAQRMQTDSNAFAVHQLNVQGDVAKTAATSLGQLGGGMGDGYGGGMNPAGMMTGMMMGGAVGGTMANMMGGMMNNMNQPQPPPPPAGAIAQYHIAVNGQQSGPYTIAEIQQFIAQGGVTRTTHLWKQGMAAWDVASNIAEIAQLFGAVPPPLPPL